MSRYTHKMAIVSWPQICDNIQQNTLHLVTLNLILTLQLDMVMVNMNQHAKSHGHFIRE